MKTTTRRAVGLVLGWTLGAAVLAAPVAMAQSSGKPDVKKDQPTTANATRRVTVIFRSGREVTGEFVSETATAVKVRVEVAGMKAETEFNKADILQIKDLPAVTDPAPTKTEDKKPDVAAGAKPDASADPSAPTVYVVNFTGEFGRDINVTPMNAIYEDIKRIQPDVLVLRFDHEFAHYGEEKVDFEQDLGSFDQLETARFLTDIIRIRLDTDTEFKKKPRMVAWIKKAMGGAAFLPFVCKEMYYTSDAMHGGIGNIEHIFDGVGDERAREKQYSLRQARGEGLAELGEHDKRILRAMARTDYILCVTFKDGTPELIPDRMPKSPDELLLTDDGKDDRGDAAQDVIRGKGNDVLTLNADMALRLGLSKGTADTLDDLMSVMGLSRNYNVVKGKAEEILKAWSREIGDAESRIEKIMADRRRIRLRDPGEFRERTEFRGQHKRLLKEALALYIRYKEAINPQRVGGADNSIAGIERLLAQLDAEQRADNDRR